MNCESLFCVMRLLSGRWRGVPGELIPSGTPSTGRFLARTTKRNGMSSPRPMTAGSDSRPSTSPGSSSTSTGSGPKRITRSGSETTIRSSGSADSRSSDERGYRIKTAFLRMQRSRRRTPVRSRVPQQLLFSSVYSNFIAYTSASCINISSTTGLPDIWAMEHSSRSSLKPSAR